MSTEGRRPPRTFRLELVAEDDQSLVPFYKTGIPEATVREVANFLREMMPLFIAGKGAWSAFTGVRQMFEGLQGMGLGASTLGAEKRRTAKNTKRARR